MAGAGKEEYMKSIKKMRILRGVLKRTYADRLIAGFVVFFLAEALLVFLVEPGITTFWDAIWYMYAVFSTVGFGDIVAVTLFGRILSILLTVYTILIVAVVTGVIVAFYNDMVSMQYKASKAEILEKLEHLENCSKEELAEISARIRKIT